DDVHLFRMCAADLGAEHVLPLTGRRRLRVERTKLRVRLTQRILVHASATADAAEAPAARLNAAEWKRISLRSGTAAASATPATASRRVSAGATAASARVRRRVCVRDPLRIRASVALELLFDPIEGVPVALRALSTVAELRQSFDGRLVLGEREPADH